MTKQVPYSDSNVTIVTPKGVSCAAVGQFIVIADAENPFDVRWCAIGDPSDWPTPNTDDARSKQAGKETLKNNFGIVTGIAGGDFFGYVFQERAITKMTYVGGDIVFSFDTFEEGRGCFQYNRFATVADGLVVFQSRGGHHAVQGGQVIDLGFGVIDDSYTPVESDSQQNVATNTDIGCVFFEDNNLCYNYKTQQWTRIPAFDGRSIFSITSTTGIIGQVVKTSTWYGYTDQEDGDIQTATIETAEKDLNQGGRTLVDAVRPLLNGGRTEVSVGSRNSLTAAVTYSTGTSVNDRTGLAHFRSAANVAEGRYQRIKLVITPERLVINGDFETGDKTGWESSGGNGSEGTIVNAGTDAHKGTFVMQVASATGGPDQISHEIPVSPGDVVTASCWAMPRSADSNCGLRVRFRDASDTIIANDLLDTGDFSDTDWQFLSGSATAPANSTGYVVNIGDSPGTTGHWWFDEVGSYIDDDFTAIGADVEFSNSGRI